MAPPDPFSPVTTAMVAARQLSTASIASPIAAACPAFSAAACGAVQDAEHPPEPVDRLLRLEHLVDQARRVCGFRAVAAAAVRVAGDRFDHPGTGEAHDGAGDGPTDVGPAGDRDPDAAGGRL